jgi:hypothetical protein
VYIVYFELLLVIDSLAIADPPFVIEDSREERQKVDKGSRTKGNELTESETD